MRDCRLHRSVASATIGIIHAVPVNPRAAPDVDGGFLAADGTCL